MVENDCSRSLRELFEVLLGHGSILFEDERVHFHNVLANVINQCTQDGITDVCTY